MPGARSPYGMTRRKFLYMGGAALLAAACGNGAGPATTLAGPGTTAAAGTTAAPGTTAPGTTGAPATTGAAGEEPAVNFVEPRQSLSGELNISARLDRDGAAGPAASGDITGSLGSPIRPGGAPLEIVLNQQVP